MDWIPISLTLLFEMTVLKYVYLWFVKRILFFFYIGYCLLPLDGCLGAIVKCNRKAKKKTEKSKYLELFFHCCLACESKLHSQRIGKRWKTVWIHWIEDYVAQINKHSWTGISIPFLEIESWCYICNAAVFNTIKYINVYLVVYIQIQYFEPSFRLNHLIDSNEQWKENNNRNAQLCNHISINTNQIMYKLNTRSVFSIWNWRNTHNHIHKTMKNK